MVKTDSHTNQPAEGLLGVTPEFNQTDSTEGASIVAVRMLDINFETSLSVVREFDAESHERHAAAGSTEAQEVVGDGPALPLDSLVGRVYRKNRWEVLDDVHEADGTYNSDSPIRSEVLVPTSDSRVLSPKATELDVFTQESPKVVKVAPSNLEPALSRIRRHEELQAERDWTHTLSEAARHAISVSANLSVSGAIEYDMQSRALRDPRKAICELVEAVITANDTGQPSVQVGVSQADERWVEICVSDTEVGLAETEKRLLETGEQTPLSPDQGPGRWTVRPLVTRAGGVVSVETPGEGSKITPEIPTKPAREHSRNLGIVA
jgi:hypothetical protein